MFAVTIPRETDNFHKYRADIDGLRAIAVLLVIFFHAGFSATSGGFVGVDIFFVISGYLITGIITEELGDNRFTFANFYARRIKRIWPALFAMLGLCSLAGLLFLIPPDLRVLGSSVSSAVLFYSNWHFYTQVGYFDGPAIEKPLLHTWSLAIEEQFYLIWPLALYGLVRVAGRAHLAYAIALLAFASLAGSQWALDNEPARAFYLLPFRAWELLLGAFLAVCAIPRPSIAAANIFGVAGIAAIACAASLFDAKTPFPGLNALLPCSGAAVLIFTGGQQHSLISRILGAGPLRLTGKVSYSLYLVHWPLFSFAHIFLNRALALEETLGLIAASFALAALSFRYIEMPVRRSSLNFPRLLPIAAPAAALLTIFGIVFHATNGFPARAPRDVQEAFAAHGGGAAADDRADCRQGEAKPEIVDRPCLIGARAAGMQYDFVIWGDSHARHLASAFSGQARERGLSGIVLWIEGCPPFTAEDGVSKKCKDGNARIAAWLETQHRLKIVFLACRWGHHAGALERTLDSGRDGGILSPASKGSEGGPAGLLETFTLMRSLQLRFALVEGVPSFPFDVTYCAARARMFGRPDKHCFEFSRGSVENDADRTASLLHELSLRYRVPLVETAFAFCEGQICRTAKDGVIFYMDSNHLNTAGAQYLGSRILIPWQSHG